MIYGTAQARFSFDPNNYKHFLLLFITWPFLALITAVSNFDRKEARKMVYIFLIYYGLSYVINQVGDGADSVRYALHLKNNAERPFSDFFEIISGLYTNDSSMDFVEPLVSFIVSRFTSNYGLLFAAYSAIFGFFYLKSITLLYEKYRENREWNGLIHMIFFAFIIPITAINGFRMWTAAWIFFYGAYHVILFRDPKYLFIALSSSLVHWSYLSANAILLIYYFAGNRNIFYLPIAISSFVLPGLLRSFFQKLSLILGGGFQSRFGSYSGEEYMLVRQQQELETAWFIKYSNLLMFYYIIFAIIAIKILAVSSAKDKSQENLFSFLLLFISFVNFGKEIPSFGGRFQVIFFLFGILFIFLHCVKMKTHMINPLTLTGLFPMLLYIAVVFRQGSDSINAWLLTPLFGLPFLVPGISITDLLF